MHNSRIMQNINPNSRIDPHLTPPEGDTQIQRIALAAIPFINLYAPATQIVGVTMGAYHIYDKGVSAHPKDWEEEAKLIFTIGLTVFSVIDPTMVVFASQGVQLLTELYNAGHALYQLEFLELGKAVMQVAHIALYIGSLVFASPELIVISLLAQVLVECIKGYNEYSNDRYIETIAALLMASIRSYYAIPQAQDVIRDYRGKTLDQETLNDIFDTYSSSDFSKALKDKYISRIITDLDFSYEMYDGISFNGLRFVHCDFSEAYFENSHITNTRFDNCLMKHAYFIDSTLRDTIFTRCDMTNAAFYLSLLDRVIFNLSNLIAAAFNDSTLRATRIMHSILTATSFFGVNAVGSTIEHCNLTDTLLANSAMTLEKCTENIITKPVIAFSWNFRDDGGLANGIDDIFRDHGAIPLRFHHYPEDVNEAHLQKEVLELVLTAKGGYISIPEELLARAKTDGEIGRLKAHASAVMSFADGLFLPGGWEDVPPELMGRKGDESPDQEELHRIMMEFALTSQAYHQKKPVMGVCLGSQIINVFHGGTLRSVDGQEGMQDLEIVPGKGTPLHAKVVDLVGDVFASFSCHYRAVDDLGKGLNILFKYEDVVKAHISDDGLFLGTQFHPECYKWAQELFDYPAEIKALIQVKRPELWEFFAKLFSMQEQNRQFYRFFCEKVRQIRAP